MGVNRRLKHRVQRIENNPLTRPAAELRAAVSYLAGGPVPEDPRAVMFAYESLAAGAQPNDCADAVQMAHGRFMADYYFGTDEEPEISDAAEPLLAELYEIMADQLRAAV